MVIFKYKDYEEYSKQKEMTFDACKFIRRFVQHILPSVSSRFDIIALCQTLTKR
ncbi:hypothetical protein C7U54_07010 [Faecalibacillus intestinalis]|uniref:Transposase IS801/IS1294 domain-containing protein n=2 Tax=Faecalibacillus intestinalis TaxID=1982626 RepID=A0A2T3G0P6_9FIRM|nr:hypothetical protein C7U54_07010 [Faecalibacillus intestinalis]RGH27776.1 hypothetical protein DWV15_08530 [Coprobacillus sp. AF02-13]